MALSKGSFNRQPVRRQSYGALGSSFMFLCFVTAALLVAVQSRESFQRSASKDSAAQPSTGQASIGQQSSRQQSSGHEFSGQQSSGRVNNQANRLPSSNWSAMPQAQRPTGEPQVAAQSAPADPNAPPALRPGLADILSSSLQPVAVIYQPQLVVSLSRRQVTLYQNDELQATYDIAVGREGWETPTGSFQILNLRENPVWRNPITQEVVTDAAENPLGSRWIGFWTDGKHQIGFHGTNQDELIGQAVSHGCIRMRDADIQALFTQVALGTPVIVEP